MSIASAFLGGGARRALLVGIAATAIITVGSTSAQAASPPTAPLNPSATTGPGQITPQWDAPSSNGGAPINGYVATARDAGSGATAGSCAAAPADRMCTITGLANGVAYTVDIVASNAIGSSPAATVPGSITTPVMPPSAPQLLSMAGGNRTATATWQAPTSNGGSPITSYTATLRNAAGSFVASCSALPATPTCTFTGLGYNETYTVGVAARNATWVGDYAFATAITAAARPSAPRNVTVAPIAPTNATINWEEPSFIGGSPITEYTATVREAGSNLFIGACTTGGAARSCVIPGLTPQKNYYVDVRAKNVVGFSAATRATFVTPPIVVPGAPTAVTATPTGNQIAVGWAPPASDGGAPITAYEVTVKNAATGAVAGTCSTGGAGVTCTVTGLAYSTAYNVEVAARNSAGLGPVATVTDVRTATVPTVPTSVTAIPSTNTIVVGWAPPTSDGGTPITAYEVTVKVAATGVVAGTCSTDGAGVTCTVSGLAFATTYNVEVLARNAAGPSPVVTVNNVRTASRPGAPLAVNANPVGTTTATINWTAPTSNGGAPILDYSATVREVGTNLYVTACTVPGSSTSCLVSGLTPQKAYYVDVRARNAAGSGSSARGNFTTLAVVVPTAPTSPTATGALNTIVVGWDAPTFDGGAPITGYEVTVKNATTNAVAGTCSTNGAGRTCTVTGLAFSTAYNVEIAARNSAGLGAVAAVNGVSTATVPTAPTTVTGVPALAQITVNWGAPTSDGGAPITGYTATVKVASTGAVAGSCSTDGAGRSCTVGGLANATTYQLQVVATNAAGTSPAGLGSATVSTPSRPGAPTSLTATPGNDQILYQWAPPVSDGGSPIIGYSLTVRTQVGNFYVTACNVPAGQTFCAVTGLTQGTAYVASIRAQNAVGFGATANFPSAVTPFADAEIVVESAARAVTSIAPEPPLVQSGYDWSIPELPNSGEGSGESTTDSGPGSSEPPSPGSAEEQLYP